MSLTYTVQPPRRTRYRSMVACKNHFDGNDFDFFSTDDRIQIYTIIEVNICGFFLTRNNIEHSPLTTIVRTEE